MINLYTGTYINTLKHTLTLKFITHTYKYMLNYGYQIHNTRINISSIMAINMYAIYKT